MKHIIAVLLENEPGALSRVVGLFSARGYNIESLTVAPTEDPTLSRMTIQTSGSDDVIEQTEQSITNTERILAAAGCTLQDVAKVVLYLTDMQDYPRVNAVYEKRFAPHKPARTCVAVSALPVRERMKLDAIAIRRKG